MPPNPDCMTCLGNGEALRIARELCTSMEDKGYDDLADMQVESICSKLYMQEVHEVSLPAQHGRTSASKLDKTMLGDVFASYREKFDEIMSNDDVFYAFMATGVLPEAMYSSSTPTNPANVFSPSAQDTQPATGGETFLQTSGTVQTTSHEELQPKTPTQEQGPRTELPLRLSVHHYHDQGSGR